MYVAHVCVCSTRACLSDTFKLVLLAPPALAILHYKVIGVEGVWVGFGKQRLLPKLAYICHVGQKTLFYDSCQSAGHCPVYIYVGIRSATLPVATLPH